MLSDWDDLRYFLQVTRSESLRQAAKELRVHHTTVSRRLSLLEERLGVQLFERSRGGYVPTDAGREVLEHGKAIEAHFLALERQTLGRDRELSGSVVVTTLQEIAFALISHLRSFRAQYPRVEVHVTTSNTYANLDRREADIAIRIASAPPPHLRGRRIGSVAIAPYASLEYLDRHSDRPLREHDWVGWVDEHRDVPMEKWLREEVDPSRVACRVDDLSTLRNAIIGGAGVGHLLCWVGDAEPRLRRVGPLLENHELYLWVLTHPDLHESARITAFLSHVAEGFAIDRDLLEGDRTPRPSG